LKVRGQLPLQANCRKGRVGVDALAASHEVISAPTKQYLYIDADGTL